MRAAPASSGSRATRRKSCAAVHGSGTSPPRVARTSRRTVASTAIPPGSVSSVRRPASCSPASSSERARRSGRRRPRRTRAGPTMSGSSTHGWSGSNDGRSSSAGSVAPSPRACADPLGSSQRVSAERMHLPWRASARHRQSRRPPSTSVERTRARPRVTRRPAVRRCDRGAERTGGDEIALRRRAVVVGQRPEHSRDQHERTVAGSAECVDRVRAPPPNRPTAGRPGRRRRRGARATAAIARRHSHTCGLYATVASSVAAESPGPASIQLSTSPTSRGQQLRVAAPHCDDVPLRVLPSHGRSERLGSMRALRDDEQATVPLLAEGPRSAAAHALSLPQWLLTQSTAPSHHRRAPPRRERRAASAGRRCRGDDRRAPRRGAGAPCGGPRAGGGAAARDEPACARAPDAARRAAPSRQGRARSSCGRTDATPPAPGEAPHPPPPAVTAAVHVFVARDGNGFMHDIAEWIVEAARRRRTGCRHRRRPAPGDGRIDQPRRRAARVLRAVRRARTRAATCRGGERLRVHRAAGHVVVPPVAGRLPTRPAEPRHQRARRRRAARRGVTAERLPLGGVPSTVADGLTEPLDPGDGRPIDVLFMGGLDERRGRILAALTPHLTRHRCELRLFRSSVRSRQRRRASCSGATSSTCCSRSASAAQHPSRAPRCTCPTGAHRRRTSSGRG